MRDPIKATIQLKSVEDTTFVVVSIVSYFMGLFLNVQFNLDSLIIIWMSITEERTVSNHTRLSLPADLAQPQMLNRVNTSQPALGGLLIINNISHLLLWLMFLCVCLPSIFLTWSLIILMMKLIDKNWSFKTIAFKFKVGLNPERSSCYNPDITTIFHILSSRHHYYCRNMIRKSWKWKSFKIFQSNDTF